MDWLDFARLLPVIYEKPQMPMGSIIGAVLHTTNHRGGSEGLERFQMDWQAFQNQSAHFAVDRDGNIGQYRSLSQVAWHAGTVLGSTRYVGIEHIAKPGQELTDQQIEASGKLIAVLSDLLGFPLSGIDKPGDFGVGIHCQFIHTHCGLGVFRSTNVGDFLASTFNDILSSAFMQFPQAS
jgi:hypothetical protein